MPLVIVHRANDPASGWAWIEETDASGHSQVLTAELPTAKIQEMMLKLSAAAPGIDAEWVLVPRELLAPFAKEADYWNTIPGVVKTNDDVELWQNGNHDTKISVGDCRKIRAILSATPKPPETK